MNELNIEEIRKNPELVDWYNISISQKLSEGFIREFKDKVNWNSISISQKLSEGFIREFQDKVDWFYISKHQKLSEEFIREFQDNVNWFYISKHQKLSEEFIREFKDKVDWNCISKHQKLSEGFIREFRDNVFWYHISKHQKLSEEFIKEFNLEINSDNWLYKPTELKKEYITNLNMYECYEDYFIAYKGIRSDRYSNYNFQYQYLIGKTYESHCDCTSDENSFGLSVWTEEKAKAYCNELIIKVKVKYEDVGRVVHNNGKIRCFRFEVLD